jgi:hypothetical protein
MSTTSVYSRLSRNSGSNTHGERTRPISGALRVGRRSICIDRRYSSDVGAARSYSNARAITRVACEATEDTLLMVARHGTAEHVERLVRGFRRCKDAADFSRPALALLAAASIAICRAEYKAGSSTKPDTRRFFEITLNCRLLAATSLCSPSHPSSAKTQLHGMALFCSMASYLRIVPCDCG